MNSSIPISLLSFSHLGHHGTRQMSLRFLLKESVLWTDYRHFLMAAEVFDHVVLELALAMDSFCSFDECLCIIASSSISLIATPTPCTVQMNSTPVAGSPHALDR